MAVLGLLLVLAAAGLTVDVVLQNASSINVGALGQTVGVSPGWLFVAGVFTGVAVLLGMTLLVLGMTRARRRRVALTESRGAAKNLRLERDHLAGELYHERSARASTRQAPSQHSTAVEGRDGPDTVDLGGDERPVETASTEADPQRDADKVAVIAKPDAMASSTAAITERPRGAGRQDPASPGVGGSSMLGPTHSIATIRAMTAIEAVNTRRSTAQR
jgi:hypothetical protein